jgi:large subunit ribosomal protein L4
MKLEVHNTQGSGTGREVELPADIFGIEPNEHAVYLSVKAYLAAQRQGTHKAKERGEIAGSTRKLHRQKGTGGSRKGDIKNPLFKGGGRVFGPRPRDYTLRLNKKVRSLAKASALAGKARAGQIKILEDFQMEAPRTKDYLAVLRALAVDQEKTLLVTADRNDPVYRSSRNLPNANVMAAGDINPYEILKANTLILSEGAIAKLQEMFA